MSDFRQQVRDHYDAQSLPADKVEALLAVGRIAASAEEVPIPFPRRKPWTRHLAWIAALLVLACAGFWWAQRAAGKVSYAALPPRVIEFFGNKPDLVKAPQDKKELRDWLLSKGAPADFEIPPALLGLESEACQVVDVNGRKAYLSCYWRESKEGRAFPDLIHLLVARADDFHDKPKPGGPVMRELDGWSFASWMKGDVIYTLAAAAPLEKVTPFISLNEEESLRPISTVVITR